MRVICHRKTTDKQYGTKAHYSEHKAFAAFIAFSFC